MDSDQKSNDRTNPLITNRAIGFRQPEKEENENTKWQYQQVGRWFQ